MRLLESEDNVNAWSLEQGLTPTSPPEAVRHSTPRTPKRGRFAQRLPMPKTRMARKLRGARRDSRTKAAAQANRGKRCQIEGIVMPTSFLLRGLRGGTASGI